MAKRKPVTDAELVAACIAWGTAWNSCMTRAGPYQATYDTEGVLYHLCLRAAKEREAKPAKKRGAKG